MKKVVLTLSEQQAEQEKSISRFIEFFLADRDFTEIVYTDCTAKDVLGHVASWHISFAKNLLDAVNGNKPDPFKGSLTEVNEREVEIMSKFSVSELITKIKIAQDQINKNIEDPSIKSIAYKKGSRDYSPIEHLEIVRRHINSHLYDLEKIFNKEKKY